MDRQAGVKSSPTTHWVHEGQIGGGELWLYGREKERVTLASESVEAEDRVGSGEGRLGTDCAWRKQGWLAGKAWLKCETRSWLCHKQIGLGSEPGRRSKTNLCSYTRLSTETRLAESTGLGCNKALRSEARLCDYRIGVDENALTSIKARLTRAAEGDPRILNHHRSSHGLVEPSRAHSGRPVERSRWPHTDHWALYSDSGAPVEVVIIHYEGCKAVADSILVTLPSR